MIVSNEDVLGKYRHYSGKEYEVIGIAHHSETLEELVVYRGLYNCKNFGENPLWVRPKDMFFESVIIDGKEQPRFQKIKEVAEKNIL